MKNEIQQFEYCNEAIELKNKLEGSFLELGERLYQIKENSLYEANWASWVEFCWELKMSDNTINKLIQIYKTLVLGYGFNQQQIINAGGWTIVSEVLPMVTSKKEALKWLNLASTLTRSDLRKTIREAKTGIDMGECAHENTRKIIIEICNTCGQKHEVFEGEIGWGSKHKHNAYGLNGSGSNIINTPFVGYSTNGGSYEVTTGSTISTSGANNAITESIIREAYKKLKGNEEEEK